MSVPAGLGLAPKLRAGKAPVEGGEASLQLPLLDPGGKGRVLIRTLGCKRQKSQLKLP